MSILTVLGLYALWSICFPLGKHALSFSPPLFLTATRMLVGACLILLFLFFRNRQALKVDGKQLLMISLFAFFGIYLTNALEFWSLQHLSAAKTCFIYSFCPFFSALFSYLHFKEKMNTRKWIGLVIGFSGIIPVLASQKGAGELLTTIPFLSWPEIAMMGAAVCAVYGWILMRILVKDSSKMASSLTTNGYGMLIGGLLSLAHSLFVDSWGPLPVATSNLKSFGITVLWMTFIANIICYNLNAALLKRFTATFVSFMGLLSPIFTSLTSLLILGEPISPTIFFATAIVSIGAWFVHSAELKLGYIVSKKELQRAD